MKNDLEEDHIALRSIVKTAIHARTQAWFPSLWLICAVTASLVDAGDGAPALSSLSGVSSAQAPKPSPQFSANPTTEELFRAHVFQEPLVPVGSSPSLAENAALADALQNYATRSGPDDFSALTDFLKEYPDSSWDAALQTDLGLEYYNTAHYSLAIDAWSNAWSFAGKANDAKSVALVSRAFGELIKMNSRLGRMDEVERLLNSTGNHPLPGPAAERVVEAREALWNMKNHPEISFRCGPLALRSIRLALSLPGSSDAEISKSASTQKGFSLLQVAEHSRKIGLNYQMAFRNSGDFVLPSVVHWKVGHYAAMIRKVGDLYELHDPTFGNNTWATKEALEAETTGYFLVAPGPMPQGWRAVDEKEGAAIWGKGLTTGNDPQNITKRDFATGGCPLQGHGMAVAKVYLMNVDLNLMDNPLSYKPPIGPSVPFVIRYNQRDVFQSANVNYGNLGPLWTSDWITYITDNPDNLLADVNLYVAGGGQRTYINFNTNSQSFDYQQYDQNLLTRTGSASYQLLSSDGSKMIFSQSDGSTGSSRDIFLTQQIDPQGNAVTFGYDTNFCITSITDAIGQVTTLTYGIAGTNVGGTNGSRLAADPYKLTSVTDPFGRTATLTYEPLIAQYSYTTFSGETTASTNFAWGLATDTDEIGITSQFGYQSVVTSTMTNGHTVIMTYMNIVNSLTTPYGTTSFVNADNGNTRSEEITYPDGSRERVEYNQSVATVPTSDANPAVPVGMLTDNAFLEDRDTYYWDRTACSLAYGDYTKARLFHFLHTEDLASTSGALESFKLPLEGRVWFDYAGQNVSVIISTNTLPAHIGRVLDDGTTQLYTYTYNGFGRLLNSVDPLGRTMSYIYDTNGIDLLEIRQTRATNNELLARMTYNSQHCLLTYTDASGQTTTFAYNRFGQLLSATNPLNQAIACTYDANGYLLSMTGPLPGANDTGTLTYDAFGRVRTTTDVSGYTMTYDYDNLDRITTVTYPDSTFAQCSYTLLDCTGFQDRAGRVTSFEYDSMRHVRKITDPLGRTTLMDWCRCGSPKSLIDPMGRTTTWATDVQGRTIAKQYADGSQVQYLFENTTSRIQQILDESGQTAFCSYNSDDTLNSISYGNAAVPTPSVYYAYDPDYLRPISMTDGVGTTLYSYNPITPTPALGAGRLASSTGPLPDETTTYAYDALGRRGQISMDGATIQTTLDAAGRVFAQSNALGSFTNGYDGSSMRPISRSFPNGQATGILYGTAAQDFQVRQISHTVGGTALSMFNYGQDVTRGVITNWSQQAGAQAPSVYSFGYDSDDELISAAVTHSGAPAGSYSYSYDPAGNRLTETIGANSATSSFNPLNQLSVTANSAASQRTNEWDSMHRLTAINAGNLRTELGYDGASRLAYIQQLQNGTQISFRRFVWIGNQIAEERDASGSNVTKRFFAQGVQLTTGTNAGSYYYTRDHLGSVRELTDTGGNVRARYSYDPYGRMTKLAGDLDADFGFAGMLWSPEASLFITHFREYDPNLGRWLSRDPLRNAEIAQGPNLYAYVRNNPVNLMDQSGEAPLVPKWLLNQVNPAPEQPAPPLNPNYQPTQPAPAPEPVPESPPPAAEPPPPAEPEFLELQSDLVEQELFGDVTQITSTAGTETLAEAGTEAVSQGTAWIAEAGGTSVFQTGAAAGPQCLGFADLFSAPGGVALVIGGAIGVTLDVETDIDDWFADQGLAVQNMTGSRALGAIATVQMVGSPIGWYEWISHEIYD
jgi:RHS repeat-associated protein